MPIQRCKRDGKLGWKWGKSGKCYLGPGGKAKARRQERAIRASGWTEHEERSFLNTRRTNIGATLRPKNGKAHFGNSISNQRAPNPLRSDPTRTATLRRKFVEEVRRRFLLLRKDIIALIIDEDAFGLKPPAKLQFVNQRFAFSTKSQQVEAFQKWLGQQLQYRIMGVTVEQIQENWWQQYVEEGYRKGAGRAFDDTKAAQRAVASTKEDWSFYQGGKEEFLRSAFGRPESVEKVKLLTSRVFTELKGVNDAMAQRLTRDLADGLVQGQNPRTIAKTISKSLGIGRNRAEVIARTEIIRAHAEGQLDAMEQLGVTEVGVAVEWSTAGDDRVCDLCAPLEGVVMKIDEARGLIPRHAQCRCAHVPANVGEDTKGQKRSKSAVESAIDRSIRAEIPKKSKRTLAEQKARTSWVGADKKIGKSRPKPLEVGYA